ncbi:MAG: adenine phosphoribosyltransferase [Candidatus Eutrophobiaceae bacterium]
MKKIAALIRNIPDFPHKGIQFKDITPLLANPEAMRATVQEMRRVCAAVDYDYIAACEARGFIFGSLLAWEQGLPFVPLRKSGKLPAQVHRVEYELEYGTAALEIHQDALTKESRVLLVDDLLATGGTTLAACQLVQQTQATVAACVFVIELDDLNGRERLPNCPIFSLLHY